MKAQYRMKNMPLIKQSMCVGDLVRYYGETRFKLLDKVRRIQSNQGLTVKLLNILRTNTKSGLTLDNLITGLETVSEMDIFKFKMNETDPCAWFQEGDVVMEVYMNPFFFTATAAVNNALRDPMKIPEIAKHEEAKWVAWFEKELNKYHPRQLWEKTVLKDE
jgi:hypothetical protein